MKDVVERAEAEIAQRYPSCHQRLLADLLAELKAAREEAERWRVKAEEYRFDNRGDW